MTRETEDSGERQTGQMTLTKEVRMRMRKVAFSHESRFKVH